jgi:hypothetical protein
MMESGFAIGGVEHREELGDEIDQHRDNIGISGADASGLDSSEIPRSLIRSALPSRSDRPMPVVALLRALPFLVLAGCATYAFQTNVSPASNLPARFVPDSGQVPPPPGYCAVHLVDPGSGTRLTLTRSRMTSNITAEGDYSVIPPGSYGAESDHQLLVNCTTGEGLGIVRR